ncbi:hypothetical protein ACWEF9_30995 [Streptomyces sp. NPDC004980]
MRFRIAAVRTVVVALLAALVGVLIAAALWYDIARLISTDESRFPPLARLRGPGAGLAATERWCTGLLLYGRIGGDEYRRRMSGIARGSRRLRSPGISRTGERPERTARRAASP